MQSTWPKASYVVFHLVTCLNTGSGLMYLKTQIWAICFCVRKTTLIVLFGSPWGWSALLGFECFLDSTSDFFWMLSKMGYCSQHMGLCEEHICVLWPCVTLMSCAGACISQAGFICLWFRAYTDMIALLPIAALRGSQVSPLQLIHLMLQISTRSHALELLQKFMS